VLGGKFVVDEAAHRQALRQNLAHGGGQPVGAVALSDAIVDLLRARCRISQSLPSTI
jgi:hypothetical protein